MKKKKKTKKKKNRNSIALSNTKPLISICMIVKNEENNLPECLQSVRNLADELIVVDTGSDDDTVEIAKRFGAKIYHFSWCDDFSAARNESLKHATGKWIIWLDADDRIGKEYHGKIKTLAQQSANKGFYFILQNLGFENSKALQLRMFPNHPKIKFTRPIHEQIATSMDQLRYPFEKTDIVIKHSGYSTPEIVKQKKKHYISLMQKWLQKNPNDSIIRYQHALALHTLDQFQPAVEELNLLIADYEKRPKTDPIYFYSLLLLGRSFLNLQQYDDALQTFDNALTIQPESSFLLISMAEVYTNIQDYEKALFYLQQASDEPDQSLSFFPVDYSILKGGRLVLLGKVLTKLNRFDEAYQYLVEAIKVLPNRTEGHKYLAEWYMKNSNYKQAIRELQKAAEKDDSKLYYNFKIGEIYLRLNELQKAREYFLQVEENPIVLPALWLNLALIERGCGRYSEALKYLSRVVENYPSLDETSLQLAITYYDQGNYPSSLQILNNYNQIEPKKWFVYLLHLQNGDNEKFTTALFRDNPELNGKENHEVVQHLFNYAHAAKAANQFLKAEVIYRIIIFLDQSNLFAVLSNIAQVQIKNHRVIQAISTLEQTINYCSSREELVQNLKIIGKCYLQIGVVQAYQLCNQKIEQLGTRATNEEKILSVV